MTSGQLARTTGRRLRHGAGRQRAERARSLWEEIETEGDQGTLGLYTANDDSGRSPA